MVKLSRWFVSVLDNKCEASFEAVLVCCLCQGESVVVRTEWRISGRWLVKDQTEHIYEGARRVCSHFEKRPRSILSVREDAQRLLLGPVDAPSVVECWETKLYLVRPGFGVFSSKISEVTWPEATR